MRVLMVEDEVRLAETVRRGLVAEGMLVEVAHEVATVHPEAVDWPTTRREVLAGLDRLDRLVSDWLLLARSDEHGLRLRLDHVDLREVLEAEAERVVDRFVRLDQSRTRDRGGTGLGLPIARPMARVRRGDLTSASDPTGARFELALPLTDPDEDRTATL